MKLRTLDEFSNYIRGDLSWRRKELRVLDGLVKGHAGAAQQAVLRGAVAALYAHWEGFVKNGSGAYIDFVRLRGLRICDLKPNFIGLIIRGRVRHLANGGGGAEFAEFVDWLLREWESRAYLPNTEKLSTQSNLSVEVFKDIVHSLGLPYLREYQTAENTVIMPLLVARNDLAHGEWHRVEQDEFEQYFMWIDHLMVRVCDSIEEAAAVGSYRRQPLGIS